MNVHLAMSMVDDGGAAQKSMLMRRAIGLEECDALAVKGCKEIDEDYSDFIGKVYDSKPLLLAGPVVPETPAGQLDEQLDGWLSRFSEGSVVYFGLGSESSLPEELIREILLGLEISGLPFMACLKPPINYETIVSALPEGFTERTEGRGVVCGDWEQQQLILQHPSVGCFVNPCDARSLSEAVRSDCQLVFVPHLSDQFINARMMSLEVKIGVEVEKEDGMFFSKEKVCEAIKAVMEVESEVGSEIRANYEKWRDLLLSEGLEESYTDGFFDNLRVLLG